MDMDRLSSRSVDGADTAADQVGFRTSMTTTRASVRHAIETVGEADEPDGDAIGSRRGIIIERITPELDGGRYPVKRVVGDQLLVTADIFADGHGLLDAAVLLRADDETAWRRAPMRPIDNDRWSGHVELLRNRRHVYAVEAWRDAFGSWRDGLRKKLDAGVAVPNEIEEGRLLLVAALRRAEKTNAGDDAVRVRDALAELELSRSEGARAAPLLTDDLLGTLRRHADLRSASQSQELPLIVDRERARRVDTQ